MYDNALIPIALANKLVSLSDFPSSRILETFAESFTFVMPKGLSIARPVPRLSARDGTARSARGVRLEQAALVVAVLRSVLSWS